MYPIKMAHHDNDSKIIDKTKKKKQKKRIKITELSTTSAYKNI